MNKVQRMDELTQGWLASFYDWMVTRKSRKARMILLFVYSIVDAVIAVPFVANNTWNTTLDTFNYWDDNTQSWEWAD